MKELRKALEKLEHEIFKVSNKYQMMSEDLLQLALAINEVAMSAPEGTFEGIMTMTCKDCKSRHACTEPNKSYEYDKDGDSWANRCDDFDTIHEDKTVVKDGLRITQSGYSFNVWVRDDETGKLLFHCICQDEWRNLCQMEKTHTFCRIGEVECPFFGVVDCRPRDFKAKPFQTKDGKYILIEVKE